MILTDETMRDELQKGKRVVHTGTGNVPRIGWRAVQVGDTVPIKAEFKGRVVMHAEVLKIVVDTQSSPWTPKRKARGWTWSVVLKLEKRPAEARVRLLAPAARPTNAPVRYDKHGQRVEPAADELLDAGYTTRSDRSIRHEPQAVEPESLGHSWGIDAQVRHEGCKDPRAAANALRGLRRAA